MSEQYNPFEAALNEAAEEASANPFESPASTSAGTQSTEVSSVQTEPVIDLGSQSDAKITFPPFLQTIEPEKSSSNESTKLQVLDSRAKSDTPEDFGEIENPIAAAMEKQDKAAQQSIFAKPPVFEHGSVKEPIENGEQTFDDLRIEKSDDFPELEDSVRVSWEVTYGKIRKSVPTPKKTKIGEFKKQIESSKEFLDALKKDKNKSPDCVIKPRITAQSKGQRDVASISRCGEGTKEFTSYKALFTNMEDAEKSGKIISIVPGRNGVVYEIRREEMGTFITPSGECKEFSEIRAGFTPALPLVPRSILLQIIGFFRSVMRDGEYEAIANIYWDRENGEFVTVIPKQHVTAIMAESELSGEYDAGRHLHYMDIHSHNVMQARFSAQDDADEKATRLYAVIGRLNEFLPEMSVRISNGGKYLLIDPSVVFESIGDVYPVSWNEQVTYDTQPTITHKTRTLLDTMFGRGFLCA